MKKLVLIATMALAMTAFAVPAMAQDVYVDSGEDLVSAVSTAQDGDVIYLQNDITLNSPAIFDQAVTIDGTSSKYAINGISSTANFKVGDGATVQNLELNATGSVSALVVQGAGSTVKNCDINTELTGINFYATGLTNPTISISNCVIKNTLVSNYDQPSSYPNDSRGLSLYNVKAGDVDVSSCQIYGFAYSINSLVDQNQDSTLRDGLGTTIDVSGTIIKGWTALNLWSADTDITFTNCDLEGINVYNGSWDSFATIRANDGIYGGTTDNETTINLIGGSVIAKQYGLAAETPFTIDNELQTKFTFRPYLNLLPVSIEVYVPTNEAAIFTFPYGVSETDMNNYMNSDKLDGFFDPSTGEFNSVNVNIIAAPISSANAIAPMSNISLVDNKMPIIHADSAVGGNIA